MGTRSKAGRVDRRSASTRNANQYKIVQQQGVKGEAPLNRAQRRAQKRGR